MANLAEIVGIVVVGGVICSTNVKNPTGMGLALCQRYVQKDKVKILLMTKNYKHKYAFYFSAARRSRIKRQIRQVKALIQGEIQLQSFIS